MHKIIPLVVLLPSFALAASPQCAVPQEPTKAAAPDPSQPPLDQIPALSRIKDAGAQLTDLGVSHGMRTVFVRKGNTFQVFYIAPDGQAVIGGVLWDSTGENITRKQVEVIDGVIPTVTMMAIQSATKLAEATTTYGLVGKAEAPRLWMFFDPQCSFSIRAMQALHPFVTAGKVRLALIPVDP